MENIGDYLKQLREKKGISIEDAVSALKISYSYLKAFEDGNFDSLSKDTYTRIFLRVYTEYLNGDVKAVMAGFTKHSQGQDVVKDARDMNKKPGASFNPNLIWMWAATILVAIVFIGLFCNRKREKPVDETFFEEEKEAPKQKVVVKKEVNTQKPENVVVKKLVLKADALEDVNLEMIVDDKITIKEVMKKGDSRIWTAKSRFLINTENVGALDFTFNDERFGVLGALGESRSGISFPPSPGAE